MSSVLPVLSGREVVKILSKAGWVESRQRGSHIILTKTGHVASLSVPDHREVERKFSWRAAAETIVDAYKQIGVRGVREREGECLRKAERCLSDLGVSAVKHLLPQRR